jgi:outer membrane protein OmpA-like peptidoglycan-associated protein
MKLRLFTTWVLFGVQVVLVSSLYAWDPELPDDPAARAAAVAALATVPGPRQLNRYTRQIRSDVRDVPGMAVGLESGGIALKANIEILEKAIDDLDAEVLEQEIRVALSADLLFDFDQHSLKPEARAELESLALVVREKARGAVRIAGHTDSKGSEAYNQALSERRAHSVRKWLLEHGELGSGVKIEISGRGESEPVAPNQAEDGSDDPEGRSQNRRVEVFIETTR